MQVMAKISPKTDFSAANKHVLDNCDGLRGTVAGYAGYKVRNLSEAYDPTRTTSVTILLPIWETLHDGRNYNDPKDVVEGDLRVVNIAVPLPVFDEIYQKAPKTGKLLDLTEEGVLKIEQDYEAGKNPKLGFSMSLGS